MSNKNHIYLKSNMRILNLDKQKVIIYILDITGLNPDEMESEDEMPKERYEKMKRYRNVADRSRHLGNELLFYYGLKTLYGIDDIGGKKGFVTRIDDCYGKPYIKERQDIYFNMSHSGSYSVCAFSDRPIGVDVEKIQSPHLDIARRFYCDKEYQLLISLPPKEQAGMFYQYWVMKESFVKAAGLGLKIPLNKFSFYSIKSQLAELKQSSFENSLNVKAAYRVKHQVNEHDYITMLTDPKDHKYKRAVSIEVK